jgi:hypothetical protein
MGRAKEWMMEREARGYDDAEGSICHDCVEDAYLAQWIDENATETICRFCGREADEPIAASFEEFIGVVLDGIRFDWSHPDDEGIMFISREGGYQASISDLDDVLSGYEISDNVSVVEALIESIDDNGWVERDYYIGDKSQQLKWGWDKFKRVTKHQTRYLFLSVKNGDDSSVPASQMLDAIAGVIASDLGDIEFVKVIGPDTDLVRIRIDSKKFETAADIGSPPEKFALQSNRMSPAGIPMFYGALDVDTAKAETFDEAQHLGQTISIGVFRPLRNLHLLDLAELPNIPSVFDAEGHHLIHPLRFLHAFARDLAKPIARDGREHIEYVPTQIVTEYFRRVFRVGKMRLDGLIYRSARHPGGTAVVLFCENAQCVDPGATSKPWKEPLLRLESVSHEACPALPNAF